MIACVCGYDCGCTEHSFLLFNNTSIQSTTQSYTFHFSSARSCYVRSTLWDIIFFFACFICPFVDVACMHMGTGHRSELPSSCSWVFKYGFCVWYASKIPGRGRRTQSTRQMDLFLMFFLLLLFPFFFVFILHIFIHQFGFPVESWCVCWWRYVLCAWIRHVEWSARKMRATGPLAMHVHIHSFYLEIVPAVSATTTIVATIISLCSMPL